MAYQVLVLRGSPEGVGSGALQTLGMTRPDDCSSYTVPMMLTSFPLQASPSPSPVGYSPMTPGAPSPGGYNPHTPGSGIEQNSSDWVTTDIQVKVRDTYLDTQVVGQTGIIRSVTVCGPRAWGAGIIFLFSHLMVAVCFITV